MPSSLSGQCHPALHDSKPDLTVTFIVPNRGISPSTVASHSGRSGVSYIDCTRTAGQSHACDDNDVGFELFFTVHIPCDMSKPLHARLAARGST